MSECLVVADIGQNHNGSLHEAVKLIDAAAEAGVWAVKGQKRDMAGHPEWDRPYESPHSYGATYQAHREALELSWDDHELLAAHASGKGLVYFVSGFDLESLVEAAERFEWLKAPSCCLRDVAMMEELADQREKGQRVVLSTGLSSWTDVAEACRIVTPDYLLQCTSSYPCAPDDVNLRVMVTYAAMDLADRVGFSSHSLGTAVEIAAAARGARMVEVHLTLDRSHKGRDHSFSKLPNELAQIVNGCAIVTAALGDDNKRLLSCEHEAARRLGVELPTS